MVDTMVVLRAVMLVDSKVVASADYSVVPRVHTLVCLSVVQLGLKKVFQLVVQMAGWLVGRKAHFSVVRMDEMTVVRLVASMAAPMASQRAV